MGTLQNQKPREWLRINDDEILDHCNALKKIAAKASLTIDQVIKIAEIKQFERRNNLYVANGNIHDEQMSGIGDYLEKIDSNLEQLATAMENHNQ